MKIGILGAGNAGQIIGSKRVEVGQDVLIGARNPSKLRDWLEKSSGNAKAGSLADAAAHGEILFNAIRGSGSVDALAQWKEG